MGPRLSEIGAKPSAESHSGSVEHDPFADDLVVGIPISNGSDGP